MQGMRRSNPPVVTFQHAYSTAQGTADRRPPRRDGEGEEGKRGEVLIKDESGTSQVGLAEAPPDNAFFCGCCRCCCCCCHTRVRMTFFVDAIVVDRAGSCEEIKGCMRPQPTQVAFRLPYLLILLLLLLLCVSLFPTSPRHSFLLLLFLCLDFPVSIVLGLRKHGLSFARFLGSPGRRGRGGLWGRGGDAAQEILHGRSRREGTGHERR